MRNRSERLRRPRRGFTLTEILVVLVIIAILSAIAFSVFGPASNRAHVRATESLIQLLTSELDGQMSAFARRQFAPDLRVAPPDAINGWETITGAGGPFTRATVLAKIRHMAAAFPDTLTELCDGGNFSGAVFNLHPPLGWDDPTWSAYGNPRKHPWIAQQRTQQAGFPIPVPANQALDSSECLYLIITEGPNATPGFIDKVERRFIKTDPTRIDANGEGLKYFADAWGNPVRFDRWAVTTVAFSGAAPFQPQTLLANPASSTPPPPSPKSPYDPNGLLRDASWNVEPATAPLFSRWVFEQWFLPVRTNETGAATNRTAQGFGAMPVLTSAGPDGNMGLGGVTLNRQDPTNLPAIIQFDQPLDDGSGGFTDNISSATLQHR